MKKVIVGFIGIVASVIIGVSTASAAVNCYSATIEQVSILPDLAVSGISSKYALTITCADSAWAAIGTKQYLLTEDIGTAGYVMALTAMESAKNVQIKVLATSWNSLLSRIIILE